MTCSRFSWETLSDYFDGALPAPTRWRIARHMKTCPDCARQLAALEDLATAARARFAHAATPVSLTPGVLAALPDPLAQKEVRQMIRRYQVQAAFATAGTLAAVVGIGFVALTPILHPTPALADVEQAMKTVTTIQWDQIEERRQVANGWSEQFQRDRSRWATDLRHNVARIDTSPTSYMISTETEDMLVNGKYARRTAHRQKSNVPTSQQYANSVIRFAAGNVPANAWKRTEEVVAGVRLVRFEQDVKFTDGTSSRWSYWIDPKSRLTVRTEEEVRDGQYHSLKVRENIRYNEPLAPENFSLTTPKGVKIVR